MEMKKVLLLALLGHAASANEAIECYAGTNQTCPTDFLCAADNTDRTGQRGLCTRPMQWAGDECNYLIGDNPGFVDSCDATLDLICVSGELRSSYKCQPMQTTPYGGCLSTAASFMTQCANDMVCIGFAGARQQGQCQLPSTKRGGRCTNLVISGPGYQDDSCGEDLVCRDHKCILVSTDGTCKINQTPDKQIFCPSNQACKDQVCIDQPLPVYCNSDQNCRSSQICIEGQCMMAAWNGVCNQDSQLPYAEQAYCPSDTFCLPDAVGDGHTCMADMCYGKCGAGTMCDNSLPGCVELEECSTSAQNKCCVPSKNVNPQCTMSQCVIDMDAECANKWDHDCVGRAMEFCGVKC